MADTHVPLTRPWMDDRETEAVGRVIRSGWIMQGPEVEAFEREFREAVDASHACAVSSGTAALHLALRAVGVGPGDEVVTASYSFIATANAARHCGAVPVFADIEAGGPNLDPSSVAACVGPKTRAILCVHQMGMPCDVRALVAVAGRHGVPLVEDAACALGSELQLDSGVERIGRPHGDVACFSFHPRKVVSTGEGGMISTRHADLDRRVRLDRQHGLSTAAPHLQGGGSSERHRTLGFNYRMTDLQAAIGRVQLRRLGEMLSGRRARAERYRRLLAVLPVTCPVVPSWARPNWQSFWIELPPDVERDAVGERMRREGVATRPGIPPAHREPMYEAELWVAGPTGLGRSEHASDRILLLPLFPQMSDEDQDRVVKALETALQAARQGAAR